MNTARVTAYAKLNLTLDITGREAGYHLLDSLVCSIDLSDLIVVRRRRDRLVNVYMHGMGSEEIPPEQNNAFRAAEAFVKEFSTPGADITVYKNIPIGAGLGGSSADAAGAINALAKLYGVADRAALRALAAEYGSDTAYMLDGGFARIRGRGEKIEWLEGCPRLYFLLICPESGVSAGQCYAEWDEMSLAGQERTERAIGALRAGDRETFGTLLGNDLYPAAARLNADAARAAEEAASFSPLGSAMTGSGSAAFAWFENEEFTRWAKSRYRGKYRTFCVKTTDPGEKKAGWRSPFALSDEERGL